MRVEDTVQLYFVKWTLQHFTPVHVVYCKVCAHERSLEGLHRNISNVSESLKELKLETISFTPPEEMWS